MVIAPSFVDYFRNLKVSIYKGTAGYSDEPPYNPSVRYPEYIGELGISKIENPGYEGVRHALRLLDLDASHFGTSDWNPLSEVVKPGEEVVIKPNFVLSDHYQGGNLYSIITHPSVLRAIVDYVYIALRGNGKIIIADTPQMDCDFQELMKRTQLHSICDLYRGKLRFEVSILDLREFWFKYENENYVASQEKRKKLPGDPEGSVLINLGEQSAFVGKDSSQFYGADYDRDETVRHQSGRHEYQISGTMLHADVLISVPKLKVHKKVGATLNAKGLVGTVTNKNCLVHYTLGAPEHGGDQFPRGFLSGKKKAIVTLQRELYDLFLARRNRYGSKMFKLFYNPYRIFIKPLMAKTNRAIVLYDGGNWFGNDSAWRMVSDLMKIWMFADRNGDLQKAPQRRIFSIIDGIIGGEGNGPLFPDERRCGVILAGFNHFAVDLTALRIMGFDWRKLKWVTDLMNHEEFDFCVQDVHQIRIKSNQQEYLNAFASDEPFLSFTAHPGWQGHFELGRQISKQI